MKLSENFSLEELTKSQTATRLGIDNTPDMTAIINLRALCKNVLQPIRDNFGIPFTPNSGFRSLELNEKLGSSKTSQHCKGQAVDIEVPTMSNLELANWCSTMLDFDQIILEFYKEKEPSSGWVHISYNIESNRKKYLSFDGKQYKEMK
jgi:zinc D-Ala-D-Ala carboxypeptidase